MLRHCGLFLWLCVFGIFVVVLFFFVLILFFVVKERDFSQHLILMKQNSDPVYD